MSEEQDHLSGCRDCLVVSERCQGNLTPGADPNIHNLPEGLDDDDNWDFNGAIGGDSVQCAALKRK